MSKGRRRLALCTDTGKVTREAARAIRGADTLIGEFNYDPAQLRDGSYPPALKERIAGDWGHLSNEMGGRLAAWAVEQGTRRVVLAHLSQDNNRPERARQAACQAIEAVGARIGQDVAVSVAPRSESSGWMEV